MSGVTPITATTVGSKLKGKVAIITGGASGIGESTARLFSDQGAAMVVIADIQDELGQSVASSIGLNRCSYIHCDVSDEDQVKSMVQTTVQKYGQLHIMFSNAGMFPCTPSIMDLDLAAMDQLFAVNVRGTAACVKHAARAMVEGGVKGASIICTASVAASKGHPDFQAYVMSKHAVLGLVRSASCELGKYGIRVNCVSPAPVATPLLLKGLGLTDAKTAEEMCVSATNLPGTVLKVDHVADGVLFLASDQSNFVTGHDLVIDGGFLCR